MDVEEGSDMLLSHLARDVGHDAPTPEDKGMARKLCAELGGLPLAITQIGAFVRSGEWTLAEVLELFKTHNTGVLFAEEEKPSGLKYYGHTLASVWNMTLGNFDEQTQTLLAIVAFLDPSSIPEELFQFPEALVQNIPKLSLIQGERK